MPAEVHHEEESPDAAELDIDLTPRAPRAPGGGAASKVGAIVVLLVVCVGAFLVIRNLGSATLFFYNADEAVAQKATLGASRFRLQGTVACGSVHPDSSGTGVAFAVAFRGAEIPVVHQGDPPQLFQPGIPVVLEGAYTADGSHYASDRIFVKHTEEYVEDNGERLDEAGSPEAKGQQVDSLTGADLCGDGGVVPAATDAAAP